MDDGSVMILDRASEIELYEGPRNAGGKDGMVLMDSCIYDLYCRALISYDTALSRARLVAASSHSSCSNRSRQRAAWSIFFLASHP